MTDAPQPRTPTGPALRGLGARLRAIRVEAGLSGAQLAEALGTGWRQAKVSKIETGRQVPTADEIEAWATATSADPDQLLALHRKATAEFSAWHAKINSAGSPAALQDEIAALETSCSFLAEYQPGMIPGRLQTHAYMQQMAAGDEFLADDGITTDDLGHLLAAKLRRQSILYEPGRRIVHIIGEAALRTRIGTMTTQTLCDQITHLIDVATLDSLELGILPFDAASPIAPATGYAMYDHDLVIIETLVGGIQLTDPATLTRYNHWTNQLLDAAHTGDEAIDICRNIRDELA